MTKRLLIIGATCACIAGVLAYTGGYSPPPNASLGPGFPVSSGDNSTGHTMIPQQNQSPNALALPSPPPPPEPTPPGAAGFETNVVPELPRALIGVAREELTEVEQYLPEGAKIYVSAVDLHSERPALVRKDLDRDGIAETIVAHTGGSAALNRQLPPPLFLSVLSPEGRGLATRLSIPLVGRILVNIESNGEILPLVAQDVTGDGLPEIIAASGGGASIGGWLEVFRVTGTSYYKLAHVSGHFFSLRRTRTGGPSEISARSRYEDHARVYRWNGERFENR